jgi:uncharacterized membrane protein
MYQMLSNMMLAAGFWPDGTDLVFLSPVPREILLLALVVAAGVLWLLYRRVASRVSRKVRVALIALRVAFVAILLAILAIPAFQSPRQRAGDVFTAVLVDTSRSMSIPDAGTAETKTGQAPVANGPNAAAPVTRIDAAKGILQGKAKAPGLLSRIGEQCRVVTYAFDQDARRLSPGANPADLKAEGPYTDIFGAVRTAEADLRNVPLSAVVMLTDGARNAGGNLVEAAKILQARHVPLYVVGLGNPMPPKDYEVVNVFAPSSVRRNTEVEIYATVRSTGYAKPFDVQVFRGSTPLLTKTVTPVEGTDLQRVRMTFTPDQEGSTTYKVAIPVAADEAIKTNNSREFSINIKDDRLPVLYVEGSPRPEYRFLRKAMLADRDFRLVGLLRLAKDRLYVQGANESEKYLEKGFPDTPERLFAFQAVILGDIEAGFFTARQLELLEEFARVRGGGVVMLGGVNSFGLGKYAGTPVEKMLPLEITPADPPYSDERYNAKITAEGLKHPVTRLVQDSELNKHMWENAPQLMGITPVRGVKAGGQVLLASEKGNQPVLAVQNYGQGRVAAFTSGGSWFWQMSMPAGDGFYEKFWKQLIRWLVVGAREQFTLETDAQMYARKEPVIIKANVCGKDLKPINDAIVKVTVVDPSANKQELTMDWILSEEGAYQCRYIPQEEGAYSITAGVEGWTPSSGGATSGPASGPGQGGSQKPLSAEFRVSEPLVEFNDAGLKEDALRAMVGATGGKYFTPAEVELLPAELAKAAGVARTEGMKPQPRPIWDTPVLLGMLLGIACIDWIIRRKNGLA